MAVSFHIGAFTFLLRSLFVKNLYSDNYYHISKLSKYTIFEKIQKF